MNNFQPLQSNNAKGFGAESIPNLGSDAVANGIEDAKSSNAALNTFQSVGEFKKSEDSINNEGLAEAIAKATKTNDSNQKTNDSSNNPTSTSDERCKELFGSGDLVAAIADLNAYRFHYKDGVDAIDPEATPDKEHTGIIAQELAANPVTKSAVEVDPLSGFLKVDTKELSTTMMAVLTQMAKKILELEEKVNGRKE